MVGFLSNMVQSLSGFPAKLAGSAYHKAYRFILTDSVFGLVNFVDPELKNVVLEVSDLHVRALNNENVSDEEWQNSSDKAEKIVAEQISGNMKEPVDTIMQASTKAGSVSMLKRATDMLILVIASFASQNGASAAAKAITALIPGGKITQEALFKVIYQKLSSLPN